LTAACALARSGHRVLVLEQHYLPGGWTHSFALEGYRFSPGVHYIGELGPGQGVRNLFEGLGLGSDLAFSELNPDGFDHFLIAAERFDVPKGFANYYHRLNMRFPEQRFALARYFDIANRVVDDLDQVDARLRFRDALALPWNAPTLMRWGFSTQQALL